MAQPYCQWGEQWCKKRDRFCGQCGWEVHPYSSAAEETAPWQDNNSRPGSQTPGGRQRQRSRQRPHPPKKGNKGSGKGKEAKGKSKTEGKGKGKALGQQLQPDATHSYVQAPPSAKQIPAAPKAQPVAPPRQGQPPDTVAASSEERKLLQALLPHMTGMETLPPALREQLTALVEQDTKIKSSALHSLVRQRTKAKGELSRTRLERANYEAAWAAYLDQLMTMLQTQFAQRIEALDAYQKTEVAWRQRLQEASAAFQKASSVKPDDSITVESDDAEDLTMVDSAEAATTQTAQIVEEHDKLLAALNGVKQQAQSGAKREGSRTPRRKRWADGDLPGHSGKEIAIPDPWQSPPSLPAPAKACAADRSGTMPPGDPRV